MSNIVIISGSSYSGSRLYGLIEAIQNQLKELGHQVSLIEVAELPAEDLIRANWNSIAVKDALHVVEDAEAVVIASPVYKASYSGVLKTFLDLIPQKGLERKVLLPLFIGGSLAHLLTIDYALKPVLSSLGATHILQGVYAVDQWVEKREDGGFTLSEDLLARTLMAGEQLHSVL
ncbi:NADPH-dependent FMN reductase [Paenibacillus sp. 1001270B_150601_E10]|uniref:NADPH-dependent FMN reductase n=1 Tax=Paenibacillus sp. 1001270B_150601_E10 TaxID=2787079 RepID=UPI00189E861E|nr:NADPH-dependent FMN reductase [Paenibacillus sp. 1001270B_150601_E10]